MVTFGEFGTLGERDEYRRACRAQVERSDTRLEVRCDLVPFGCQPTASEHAPRVAAGAARKEKSEPGEITA